MIGLEFASILNRSLEGRVECLVKPGDEDPFRMVWSLDKAREIHGMLGGAIEAAVSDQLLVAFLVNKVGLSVEKAVAALLDFREMRQGSRATVYPQ